MASKLQTLIQELCPDGVEFRTLGELGDFFSGLSGKSRKDFENGNSRYIPYKNVYANPSLDPTFYEFVRIGEDEKQNAIQLGDILFTGSSETPDECGLSAVVDFEPEVPYYLNSFCFGLRFYNSKLLLPKFTKHLFRSFELREKISRTASGVTRFNVSKKKMELVSIPVPPLPVQAEIVRILDAFTELTTALTAELTARKKQYEYYRDWLLTFDRAENGGGGQFGSIVKRVALKDICLSITSGGTPNSQKASYYGGTIPWLRTQEINFGAISSTGMSITEEGLNNSSAKWIPAHCIIVAMYGATVGKVGYTTIPLTTNQACCNLEIDPAQALYKYVFYALANQYDYIKSLGQGSQTNINSQIVKDLQIPLPPLDVQNRIVSILDRFDALCNDLTAGLPAEITARKKQYEYYRDKLLTFRARNAAE